MTDELKMKWDAVLGFPELYLYGAAKTAEKLYQLISDMGYGSHIKGFLVTDGQKNVAELCGLPVVEIFSFNNKNVRILVPHLGIYKEQICSLLETLGFQNVSYIGQLSECTSMARNGHTGSNDNNPAWEAYQQKSESEKSSDKAIREQILHILQEGQPDFGGIKPYQSMEQIGLEGIRPTEYRIDFYGLRQILGKEYDVLDIGCNSGFLDLSISDLVHSVTGIEYDSSLAEAANLVKNYLGISNCHFYNEDFNVWKKGAASSYHVIFSFAIHHWLNLSPTDYVASIDKLLKPGGYLCFESHIYGADAEFDECYKKFLELGYHIDCEKKLNDDGTQERLYVLFQKGNV